MGINKVEDATYLLNVAQTSKSAVPQVSKPAARNEFSIFTPPEYHNRPKPKTYGRFFSTIFFGACRTPQDAARQEHADETMPENVEKRKKISISYGANPLFFGITGLGFL